jgi:LmbE family N-acetylglucosaminyl deacetylase
LWPPTPTTSSVTVRAFWPSSSRAGSRLSPSTARWATSARRTDTVGRAALAANRLRETEDAARLLGLAGAYNLGHHDGELVADLELRAQIARLYRLTGADTLFTFDPHWPGQFHPDHRAAGQAALDAYMPAKMPLYRPEQLTEAGAGLCKLQRVFLFATEREVDVAVDVTGVYAAKLAACMAHRSQFPQGEESLTVAQSNGRGNGQSCRLWLRRGLPHHECVVARRESWITQAPARGQAPV